MRDTPDEINDLQIVVHNDDKTPFEFVVDLLRSVFARSEAEARASAATISKQGRVVCGTFPPPIANAMLDIAQKRIKAAGHPLLVTTVPVGADENDGKPCCAFCGKIADNEQTLFRGKKALICDSCVLTGANHLSGISRNKKFKYACEAIA